MCGIFAMLNSSRTPEELKEVGAKIAQILKHRGPDDWGLHTTSFDFDTLALHNEGGKPLGSNVVLGHTRLSIIDVQGGHQPLHTKDGKVTLIVNGEIYNHEMLRGRYPAYPFHCKSDSEVLLPLYLEHDCGFFNMLDGMFAAVILDEAKKRMIVARDPIGIKTMVYGYGKHGETYFASEVKGLPDDCVEVKEFPNGHYYDSLTGKFTRFYNPAWIEGPVPTAPVDLTILREKVEAAVVKRLMADVPVGVFLSGGLDSSLIAAIAKRHTKQQVLHSFSIGLENSDDVKKAREVATFVGTEHHEKIFTIEEGLERIPEVIKHLESYDVSLIRSGACMSLLCELIAKYVKVALTGEGADEVVGGYLYFYDSPSPEALHEETKKKVLALHGAQVMFVDRLSMMHSLEARVPFLDLNLLDYVFGIRPEDKLPIKGKRMEKHMLRSAFKGDYLPDSVLWRQKEQFGDGVGYGWIDGVKDFCKSQVADEEVANAAKRWSHDPPTTHEAVYMRKIFDQHFPPEAEKATPAKLVTRWAPWSDPNANSEPGGRVQNVHNAKVSIPSAKL